MSAVSLRGRLPTQYAYNEAWKEKYHMAHGNNPCHKFEKRGGTPKTVKLRNFEFLQPCTKHETDSSEGSIDVKKNLILMPDYDGFVFFCHRVFRRHAVNHEEI